MVYLQRYGLYTGVLCWIVIISGYALHTPFLFDNVVQASAPALHFLTHPGSIPFVPEYVDAGHPPLWGLYLSLCWWAFGTSLWVAHLAMVPILLLLGLTLVKVVRLFIPSGYRACVLLLLLLEPTLLAQATLISPDIAMLACVVGLFYIILTNPKVYYQSPWFWVCAIALPLLNLRGLWYLGVVGLPHLVIWWRHSPRPGRKQVLLLIVSYAACLLPALIFIWAHYQHTGWVRPEGNTWVSFQFTGFSGLAKSFAVLVWRYVDHGRFFIVGCLILLPWLMRRHLAHAHRKSLLLLLAILILIPGWMLADRHYLLHRYFLVVFTAFLLVFGYFISTLALSQKLRIGLFVLAASNLLLGHLWVWPPPLDNGWDASLAYRPWIELRQEAKAYLNAQQIPVSDVATFFPEARPQGWIDLSESSASFASFDPSTSRYVLLSNVMNNAEPYLPQLTDPDWEVRFARQRGALWIRVLARRAPLTP